MERLTRRDLVSLLEFVEESYTLTDLDDFAAHLVRKLPGLVGSDLTGYNEVNLRKRRTAFFLEPRIHLHDSVEIVNRHAHEHPLIRYHERTTDGGATKISDVLTQRELHRLGLYNEFFRPLGVMIVEKDGRRFVLTLVDSTARPLLLIEERRPPVDGRSLQALGLTGREADVLGCVAQGKTDAETGTILGIGFRTVAKHLEHIFQKLGVETRTATAVRAIEAAQAPSWP